MLDPLGIYIGGWDGLHYMGRNSYQSGKTIEKAENFVTFGPLGPLKVALALCSWYQIQAIYVLDPLGVYIGG